MTEEFNIFANQDIDHFASTFIEELKSRVCGENKDYLLNVNRTEYLDHIVSKYEISPLVLEFENIAISTSEKMIPAEMFPFNFNVYRGKSYPKQVVKYHLPFSGDRRLLRCIPNPRILSSYTVSLEGNEVCFEIIDFSGDPERIKGEAASALNTIRQQYGHLENNVSGYNSNLRKQAESIFDARKAEIMKQNQLVAALGVPVKKSGNIPRTFAVPATTRKQVVPRPSAPTEKYSPEPALNLAIYGEILQTINDTGRVFERLPSTYADKNEETLRDHLILNLEPRFQISTTGETFNKSGKTDILMRYEGKNVFVAECKFWGGQKAHFAAIDQLLSYLTWRDSKTALVYFVPTKEITAPLKAIADSTPAHPCFVADKGKQEESWFRYEFRLPKDNSRSVSVSILCFHLPNA
jgi:hypothetical protein